MKKLFGLLILSMALAGCGSETTNTNVNLSGKTTNANSSIKAEKPVTLEVKTKNPSYPKDVNFSSVNTAFAYHSSIFKAMGEKKNDAKDSLHIIFANFSSTNPAEYGKSSDISASKWSYDYEFSPRGGQVASGEFVLDIYLATKNPKIGTDTFEKSGVGPFISGVNTGFLAHLVMFGKTEGELGGRLTITNISDSKVSGDFSFRAGATDSEEEVLITGKFDCPIVSEENISSVKKF